MPVDCRIGRHIMRSVVLVPVFALLFAPAGAAPPAPVNLSVVERTETAARIRWQGDAAATRGFKIRRADAPNAYPALPATYPGGRACAFSWTTDDGYADNLIYHEIFSAHGVAFTAFVNSSTIGIPNKLLWSDVEMLHLAGHEIGNHTRSHTALIDDRALTVRYTGLDDATVAVEGNWLRTRVDGVLDLEFLLTDLSVDHLVNLVSVLEAHPDYSSTLLYDASEYFVTLSQYLDPVSEIPIGHGAVATLTTERGVHDDAELYSEVLDGKAEIEAVLQAVDPSYVCRTLGYPNHAHRQWAMSALNELGVLAARSGPPGDQPFFSEGSYVRGFMTTYEAPLNVPRPSNSWDETFTRTKYQGRVAAWKAAGTWAVYMAHRETESDSSHVAWMLEEIAADPDVWIAPFGEVAAWMDQFYTDVGNPVDGTGWGEAWVHDVDPAGEWVTVTAYDDLLDESVWVENLWIPASATGAPVVSRLTTPGRAVPNPFRTTTTFVFAKEREWPVTIRILDVLGREIRRIETSPQPLGEMRVTWDGRDAAGRPLPSGVWFWKAEGGADARGRVQSLR